MRDRVLPGSGRTVSPIGLAVRALLPARAGTTPDPVASSVIARAFALGVRVFDVSAGRSTATAQRWVGGLAARDPGSLFVLSPIGADAARAPRELLRPELLDAQRRLGGHPVDLLLVQRSMLDLPPLREALDRARADGAIGDWGVALPPGPTGLAEARRGLVQGARSVRLPLNLLDRSPGEEILDLVADAGGATFVTDPHAQGLLDGSLVRSGAPTALRPTDGPALARQFAPVRGLAYLTASKERTLPQAAVQYAISRPSVVCALLDLSEPDQLETLVAATELPPLSSDLLGRLRAPDREGGNPTGPPP